MVYRYCCFCSIQFETGIGKRLCYLQLLPSAFSSYRWSVSYNEINYKSNCIFLGCVRQLVSVYGNQIHSRVLFSSSFFQAGYFPSHKDLFSLFNSSGMSYLVLPALTSDTVNVHFCNAYISLFPFNICIWHCSAWLGGLRVCDKEKLVLSIKPRW